MPKHKSKKKLKILPQNRKKRHLKKYQKKKSTDITTLSKNDTTVSEGKNNKTKLLLFPGVPRNTFFISFRKTKHLEVVLKIFY